MSLKDKVQTLIGQHPFDEHHGHRWYVLCIHNAGTESNLSKVKAAGIDAVLSQGNLIVAKENK